MTPVFAFILEDFQERLKISDGELMKLAREVAHNGGLHTLAHLTKRDCEEMIFRLEEIERDQQRRASLLEKESTLAVR